ncbi:MAG: terminase family protein [Candidatus Bathyarchaeota archaeon]|nr:terminase family protein [Candidatus Bathyarchaeota archaeon]
MRDRSFVREQIIVLDVALQRKLLQVQSDPEAFFREVLDWQLTEYQREAVRLFDGNQFLALRWSRQSGKSTTCAGLLLRFALYHPDCYIAVVGPSWRQTKLNVRRIGSFVHRLGDPQIKVQKTRISFPNNTVIEAFPNNPDTIRGYTLDLIWWDEVNFTAGDQDMYDAMLFALGTRNGKLLATSTPWNTDSVFWRMCNHESFSDFARHHVRWEQTVKPHGPWPPEYIEKIRRQYGEDLARWRREMEAEWAEDEDVWLPQSLIAACIGTVKNCGEDLQPWNPEEAYSGDLYAGLDLAQTRDYCVLAVVEHVNDMLLLRHLKIFSQPTLYSTVLGYLKALQDRWGGFQKIRVDITREGPSIIADMENAGIENAEGVNFTVPRKSEMASLLKQRMMDKRFFYPYLTWEKPYRGDICTELNVERFDLRKDGAIGFSHPNGTHDDVFWSVALAVYATVEMQPEPFLAVVPR